MARLLVRASLEPQRGNRKPVDAAKELALRGADAQGYFAIHDSVRLALKPVPVPHMLRS